MLSKQGSGLSYIKNVHKFAIIDSINKYVVIVVIVLVIIMSHFSSRQ